MLDHQERKSLIGCCVGVVLTFAAAGCSSDSSTTRIAVGDALPAEDTPSAAPPEADSPEDESVALSSLSIAREPWQFDVYEGESIRTTNYRIFTTVRADDNQRFLDRLPSFYEGALTAYTTSLGELPLPDSPMETYIFQDRRQWEAKTRQVLPRQADSFRTLGRGGFATRGVAVLYYIDWKYSRSSRDTFAIAAHEGWHQYTQKTFKHHLPVWLEEGIATYMEGFSIDHHGNTRFRPWRNYERQETLQKTVDRDDLIPLEELISRTPQSFLENGKNRLLAYYAQVWALTHFLASGEDGRYADGLRQVLRDAAEGELTGKLLADAPREKRNRLRQRMGMVGPEVIEVYFNANLEEFEQAYMDYVREIAKSGVSPTAAAAAHD